MLIVVLHENIIALLQDLCRIKCGNMFTMTFNCIQYSRFLDNIDSDVFTQYLQSNSPIFKGEEGRITLLEDCTANAGQIIKPNALILCFLFVSLFCALLRWKLQCTYIHKWCVYQNVNHMHLCFFKSTLCFYNSFYYRIE